nr:hypothetical protein [uncultured Cellulosilyticum sp.]
MYFPVPDKDEDVLGLPLQSILFGHRLKQDQTTYEYLLEFLQVMLAKKVITTTKESVNTIDFFPEVENDSVITGIKIKPVINMGLRRFIFFDRSKKDTQSPCDQDAFEAHKDWLKEEIELDQGSFQRQTSEEDIIEILQGLLYSFSGILNNRSWCAQSLLPICTHAILPEAMPKQAKRKKITFNRDNCPEEIDTGFDFKQYNFMARGGEVYYLHVLRALTQHPSYIEPLTNGFKTLLNSFPQLEELSKFIQETWEKNVGTNKNEESNYIDKELSYIPLGFDERNIYTLKELANFLATDMHPFEKIEILSQGIVLQIIRMQHLQASYYNEESKPVWLMDVTDNTDKEVKKQAIANYNANEENVIKAVNKGFRELKEIKEMERDKAIKAAEDSTYKLYRRLGKEIGLIIPLTGTGMRFTLSETLIKFLVTSIIEPGKKLTVDTFIERLYEHYGMIIDSEHYERAVGSHMIEDISSRTFLYNNKKHFIQKLKECGFLRDLSDATSIIENPYLNSLELD